MMHAETYPTDCSGRIASKHEMLYGVFSCAICAICATATGGLFLRINQSIKGRSGLTATYSPSKSMSWTNLNQVVLQIDSVGTDRARIKKVLGLGR